MSDGGVKQDFASAAPDTPLIWQTWFFSVCDQWCAYHVKSLIQWSILNIYESPGLLSNPSVGWYQRSSTSGSPLVRMTSGDGYLVDIIYARGKNAREGYLVDIFYARARGEKMLNNTYLGLQTIWRPEWEARGHAWWNIWFKHLNHFWKNCEIKHFSCSLQWG